MSDETDEIIDETEEIPPKPKKPVAAPITGQLLKDVLQKTIDRCPCGEVPLLYATPGLLRDYHLQCESCDQKGTATKSRNLAYIAWNITSRASIRNRDDSSK